MTGDGAWKGIEVGRPATTTLEFVLCLVERCVASGAGIHALLRVVLVIFTREWGFSALLSEDSELLFVEYGLPLLV